MLFIFLEYFDSTFNIMYRRTSLKKEEMNLQKELEILLAALPNAISDCIRKSVQYKGMEMINEIRLREGRRVTLTYNGRNVLLSHKITKDELSEAFMVLCRRSIYSYMDTIREGYVPFSDSIRVGVCGSAVCEGGKIINVSNVTSLCIRIPASFRGVSKDIYKALRDGGFCESAVIYSKPGAGKTTLLRDISLSLASASLRVSVIDSRCEICDDSLRSAENIDIYSGYPKAKGIEIATRTMSPQYLICDEIGYSEAETILACQSMGVPMIIGAHARDIDSLIRSGPFSKLHSARLFDLYVGIKVSSDGTRSFDIACRDDIDRGAK